MNYYFFQIIKIFYLQIYEIILFTNFMNYYFYKYFILQILCTIIFYKYFILQIL
jgi:hypothetical protein